MNSSCAVFRTHTAYTRARVHQFFSFENRKSKTAGLKNRKFQIGIFFLADFCSEIEDRCGSAFSVGQNIHLFNMCVLWSILAGSSKPPEGSYKRHQTMPDLDSIHQMQTARTAADNPNRPQNARTDADRPNGYQTIKKPPDHQIIDTSERTQPTRTARTPTQAPEARRPYKTALSTSGSRTSEIKTV